MQPKIPIFVDLGWGSHMYVNVQDIVVVMAKPQNQSNIYIREVGYLPCSHSPGQVNDLIRQAVDHAYRTYPPSPVDSTQELSTELSTNPPPLTHDM